MAVTDLQRAIFRTLAQSRVERGESYVAGGVALNTLVGASRVSRGVDLFHDTKEALQATWDMDRSLLLKAGYELEIVRERPTFVESIVARDSQRVVLQWVCDSAYRFFPLVEHEDFGLVLHPFDLATNKVLALVGRLEARDWIDTIACAVSLQHLGYLVWAACGKDPGYSPTMILAEAQRSSRYTDVELEELAFEGATPRAADLSRQWAQLLREAENIIEALPADEIGRCILDSTGELFKGDAAAAAAAVERDELYFHPGTIRGAFPRVGPGT